MDTNNMNNHEGSTGPIVGVIIILAIVVLGGLYFWGHRTAAPNVDIYGNPVSSTTTSASPDNSNQTPVNINSTNNLNIMNSVDSSKTNAS